MRHDNEEWFNIWREIDLSFQNWLEEFDKFWSEHLKVSIILALMVSFWPNRIMLELKSYRGVWLIPQNSIESLFLRDFK